ncbi:MAG: response regulator [Bryobacteraceae bacterium]|jgi:CheY-like chemotaxis protein
MPKLVLIVEDTETCAETLQIALELIPGVEVRSIHSPRAAIAILNERFNDIAAIVTDLNLDLNGNQSVGSLGDGLDLIRLLRAEPRFARLPILLISGDSDPLLSERARAYGADAFFPKPYSPAAVRKKLEQLLC